jgi:hypothetical protein
MDNNRRLSEEISGFRDLWERGYFEGDPLDPLSKSSYKYLGYMSILHATYLRCIRPYINATTAALEIGPGRGAWTKALLPSKEVFVMDALSASHNKFYEYIGEQAHVNYIHVEDFSCKELPDEYFDYMFSFGTLCHVSFEGIEEYAKNLHKKLKTGANCFWMIGDYNKYNYSVKHADKLGILQRITPRRVPYNKTLARIMSNLFFFRNSQLKIRTEDSNKLPSPGRWYDAGLERTCLMLENLGYIVLDSDVGTCLRDPIIHFQKA